MTKPKLCYVVAPSYSGSTLLTLLANTHPEIATVGELKGRLYPWREAPRRCSCGEPVAECAFWQAIAGRFARDGARFDPTDLATDYRAPRRPLVDALLRARVRGPVFEAMRTRALRSWPGAERGLASLASRNGELAAAICAEQGGRLLLDSSKDATRLAFLAASGRFELRVVHLLRDGRATALSSVLREGVSIGEGARRWRRAHEAASYVLGRLPRSAVLRLRYEDLCARPLEVLGTLGVFLGVASGDFSLAFRSVPHHVFGNPMRFHGSEAIALDERWKVRLGPGDLDVFEAVAGTANRALGYER